MEVLALEGEETDHAMVYLYLVYHEDEVKTAKKTEKTAKRGGARKTKGEPRATGRAGA